MSFLAGVSAEICQDDIFCGAVSVETHALGKYGNVCRRLNNKFGADSRKLESPGPSGCSCPSVRVDATIEGPRLSKSRGFRELASN